MAVWLGWYKLASVDRFIHPGDGIGFVYHLASAWS
jgi:hypothetical protein